MAKGKFHVNGKGEAGPCRAEKGFCPFGGDEDHFSSVDDARKAYEDSMVSSFAQPASKNDGKQNSKASAIKTREKLLAEWGGRGFKSFADLSEDEKAIADPNLKRINNFLRDGEQIVRSYSSLYRYSPHMKGNKGNWIPTEIKFDHENGNLYVVSTSEMPQGGLSLGGYVASYRVKNFGNDLNAAIAYAQEENDKDLKHMMEEGSRAGKVSFAKRPFESLTDDTYNTMEHEENAFSSRKDMIRKRLAEKIPEARRWNELKKKRSGLTSEDQETLEKAGY